MRDPLLLGRHLLVDRAGRQWSGNMITLKGAIVRATKYWSHLPDTEDIECPVEFSEAELEEFFQNEEKWLTLSTILDEWSARIGMNEEGWVPNEDYAGAKKRLEELEEEVREQCEGDEEDQPCFERGWQFRDREEFY
jgi:hypothetical protein